MESLRADVEALCAIGRGSATPGEKQSAEFIAGRLREIGAADVAVVPFRYQRSWAYGSVPPALAGMLAARMGGKRGALLALAALATYEADFTGRSQWLRELLPKQDAYNVTARIPAAGHKRRVLVLVAHHDAAHTGWVWQLAAMGGRTAPFDGPAFLAAGLVALGARRAGGALFAAGLVGGVQSALAPVVPGASDNATGVAAVLALAEQYVSAPLDGTEVLLVFPGCEESGMGGMRAWMRCASLDPFSTLVLGLDTLGAGEPVVAVSEGTLGRYREEDIALAEAAGARRFRLGGWTDPLIAANAGLPAISLLSVKGDGFTNYHLPSDTPERVDWQSVESCFRLARGVVERWLVLA